MKSYHILDCSQQQKITDSLFGYYTGISAKTKPAQFWNSLERQQIKDYFSIAGNPVKAWFDELGLKVRDMSFTVITHNISVDTHTDELPVVAKINFPVLNTKGTYNLWFDEQGNVIDKVECVKPIVFRSDIPHTVKIGANAVYPRIQFSFCFYDEPLHLLM